MGYGQGAVISGVGWTPYSRKSGRAVLSLATEACLDAIGDAGLEVHDVDGIGCYHTNDSVAPESVAAALGAGALRWTLDWSGGGALCCASIAHAAAAVAAGEAEHVIVYRAMNGSSGHRLGSYGTSGASGSNQFTLPYGYATPVQWQAMACRRHMHEFGTSETALGAIAVSQRAYANLNPRAVLKNKRLTMDDYLASRYIADPLRLFDCCQETDGAVAVVVSSSSAATSLRRHPVSIISSAFAAGPQAPSPYEKYEDFCVMFPHWMSRRLFGQAGIDPTDVDIANLYDAFTFTVLCQLEDFGFCAKGEGGAFVEDIDGGRPGSRLPINTHGGLLSEGYIHGLNSVAEAVVQLRGDGGERQVRDAKVALVSGFAYTKGGALLLAR